MNNDYLLNSFVIFGGKYTVTMGSIENKQLRLLQHLITDTFCHLLLVFNNDPAREVAFSKALLLNLWHYIGNDTAPLGNHMALGK